MCVVRTQRYSIIQFIIQFADEILSRFEKQRKKEETREREKLLIALNITY